MSERSSYIDAETGAEITQWTNAPGKNQHLYFTSFSVTADERWLVIISDRDGHPNLYRLDRHSGGVITRLSANADGLLQAYVYPRGGDTGLNKASPCLDVIGRRVYFIRNDAVYGVSLDTESPAEELIYRLPVGWRGAFTHISPDGRLLCVPLTDPLAFADPAENQWEQMRRVPRRMEAYGLVTQLLVLDVRAGKLLRRVELPFWVTHVQWDPAGTERLIFNREGFAEGSGRPPHNRIWCLETDDGVRPLSPEPEGEWRSHENWSPTGRGIVYHGGRADGSAFLAERTWEGKLLEEVPMNEARIWHCTATVDGRHLLVDKPDGFIALVEPHAGWSRNLCTHGTSIEDQDAHAHPISTPGGGSFIFTSNRSGSPQVYEARLPQL